MTAGLLLAIDGSGASAQESVAADALIGVNATQRQALGITIGTVESVTEAYSASMPAEVVVPVANRRMVTVGAGGVVEQMLIAEGERVDKGQRLAVLRSPELLQRQRDYVQARLALDLAVKRAARDRRLREEGIVSERRLQESKTRLGDARARLAEQRQALLLAGAGESDLEALDETREIDSRLVLTSPVSGVVVSRRASVGERLDGAAPLYELAGTDSLQLEIHAPIDSCGIFAEGQSVRIEDTRAQGQVTAVGCTVHRFDQSILIRADISEGADAVQPGQLVEVQIARTLPQGGGWRVPRSAVVRRRDEAYLFVEADGGFRPRAVDITARELDHLVIRADLSDGDRVALSGSSALKGIWTQ